MISTDGAALIATIIPIGLLLVGVEARSDLNFFVRKMSERVRYVLAAVMGAVTGLSLFGVVLCVAAVARGEALSGPFAVVVVVAAIALLIPVALALTTAMGSLFTKNG
jgi:FtsH-binding integral membrane protein